MDESKPTFIQRTFRFLRRYFFWMLAVVAIILLALAFEGGRWSVYQANPNLSQAEQASEILARVGKLIQLPNEQPTMATINDAASAKKAQPFLTGTENGDVLIVFPNAAEALLYRPSTNKLIAVGPVNNDAPQVEKQLPPTPEPAATSSDATTTKSKK